MKKITLKNENFICKIFKVKDYRIGLALYNCYVVTLYRKRRFFNKYIHSSFYDNSYNINNPSIRQELFDETIEEYLTKSNMEKKQ